MELTLDQALQKGIEAHKAGKAQEADRYYTAILKANPNHPDANHNMGVLAVGVGKDEEALPFFKTALEVNPSIAQYWLSYIDALIKLERIAEAKAVFDQAKSNGAKGNGFDQVEIKLVNIFQIDGDKTDGGVLEEAINLRETGKYNKAIDLLLKQIKRSCTDPNILSVLSHCYILNDNLEQAKIYLDAAKEINPNIASIGWNETRLLLKQQKLTEALAVAEKTNKLFPDDLEGMAVLGSCLRSSDNFEESLNYLNKAIELNPNYAEALINRGLIFFNKKDKANALIDLEKAHKLKPHINQIWHFVLNLKMEAKDFENMISLAEEMVKLDPVDEKIFAAIAFCYQHLKNYDDAVVFYNKALSIKPDYFEALTNLGSAHKDEGKLEEAIEAYNKALSIKPDNAEAYNNKGIVLKDQGKLEEAIEAYNKALSIKPDHAEAYNNMGNAHKDQGKLEEAIEAYKKALSIKPDNVTAVQNLMKCPYGSLSEECVDIAGNFLKKFSNKVEDTSKLKFLEGNYLMHNHRLGLAFDRFCQANNKKLFSTKKLEAMNANYHIFEKKLKSWKFDFAPNDRERLKKIFILAPPRSGKSQLETLLSKSQIIKPLSDSINLQKDFSNYSFEKLFFQSEMCLQQQGFEVITTTNPHSIFATLDIAEQIPNSFFIFINRDKLDVASEIFRSDWNYGHEFGYDSKNIFRLIRFYNETSEMLLKKLVKKSLSISFEDILFQPRNVVFMIEKLCSISCNLQEKDFKKSKIPVSSIFRSHFQAKFLSC